MTLIVTPEMYRVANPDCGLTDTELERILDVSQQAVYIATCGRIEDYDGYPEQIQEKIRKAIMAQADFIETEFGADMSEELPESATIGSFSYSGGSSSVSRSPYELGRGAVMYLSLTGLLYRGGIDAF